MLWCIRGIEVFDHRPYLWMVTRGKRAQGNLSITELMDMLFDLPFYGSILFLPIGFVVLPSVAESTSVRTSSHDFHNTVVLGYLEMWHDIVVESVARVGGKGIIHRPDRQLLSLVPEEWELPEFFQYRHPSLVRILTISYDFDHLGKSRLRFSNKYKIKEWRER